MSAGIRAGSSNDGYVQVNGNDIITALSGGNVGIGVSNPSTKLHVNGTVTATNFAGAVTGTSSGNPTLTNGANNRIVTATGANALTGETNLQWDGETLYINRSSNTVEGLSISNSNNSQGSAAAQLNLSGGDNSYANIRLECNGTSHHIRQDGSGNLKFYNNTTDRVHITSAGKLSVKSSAANAVYLSLIDNDSSNEIWRVGQASDGDGYVEVLEDGGTVGCKLDASGNSFTMGNFGVGVASPGTKLTVSGGVHITSTANTSKNVDGCIIERNSGDGIVHIAACRTGGNFSGLNFYVAGDVGAAGANTKLRHTIDYQGNFSWYDADGVSLRMKIRENGNVGIGNRTSSPNSLLHVHTGSGDANVRIEGASHARLRLTAHSGASIIEFGDAGSDSTGKIQYTHSSDLLTVRCGGSGSVIQAQGQNRMGVATTPSAWQSDHYAIQVGQASLAGKNPQDGSPLYLSNNAYYDTTNSRWEFISTDDASQIAMDNGSIHFKNGGTGSADGAITWATSASFTQSGHLRMGPGKGIDFANATDIASGETVSGSVLTDYEEGTWTPTNSTVGFEQSSASLWGFYQKVGNYVTANFGCRVANNGSGHGMYIDGLPFNNVETASGGYRFGGYIFYTTTTNSHNCSVGTNSSRIYVWNNTGTQVAMSHFDNHYIRGVVYLRVAEIILPKPDYPKYLKK